MAVSKKLKKGGEARYVIQGATNNDFFTLPRGFHIRGFMVENLANTIPGGSVSLGKVPGTYTTATFAVTTAFTSSSNAATWGGGAFGTVTATAAVVTAATTASSAAYIASTSPVQSAPGLPGYWIVTANGSNITMISSVPFNMTAPTLTVGSSGLVIGTITTTAGSLDTTYMSAQALSSQFGALANLTSSINSAYTMNTSQSGATLSVTFTNTTGAAGTYTIGGNSGLNTQSIINSAGSGQANTVTGSNFGQAISIPNSFTAIATGFVMGGCSYYTATIATSASGTNFVNGVSFTSSATPSTTATNLAATIVPGWMIIASSAVVTFYATTSGFTPAPTFTAGSAAVLTTSGVQFVPGFVVPGYINANTTPTTETITVASTSGSTGKVAMNGVQITIPTGATAAQSSAIVAGASFYQFTISTSTAGTNALVVNGIAYVYTSSATQTTTATNIAALVVPGWTLSVSSATVTMIGNAGNTVQTQPTFTPGSTAIPVLSSVTFDSGTGLVGYTATYTASTAVWVGPAPVFTILDQPTTQTYAIVYTFAGSTGSFTMTQNQTLNVGASVPTISGAITTQTYTQTTTPADLPYYVNFSQEPNGTVNVYALLEKMN
jgi:trimeric autotransporter adhesin